jgi:hypothetical protein
MQMGLMSYCPEKGFPTHIYSIMSYLSNLLCFIEIKGRRNIIDNMSNIHGYLFDERLRKLVTGDSTIYAISPIIGE